MNKPLLIVSIVAPLIFGLGYIGSKISQPSDEPGRMKILEFGQLPVVDKGRVKPFDTLARNSLLNLSDRQTFKDKDGKEQPAIRWMLDVISRSPAAMDHEVFRIENLDILVLLELEQRERFRYALSEFDDKSDLIRKQAILANAADPDTRDAYQIKILELFKQLSFYRVLQQGHGLTMQDQLRIRENPDGFVRMLSGSNMPRAIPPETLDGLWKAPMASLVESAMAGRRDANPAIDQFLDILEAYRNGEAKEFNGALARFQATLEANSDPDQATYTINDLNIATIEFEVFFNHFQPFYIAIVLYGFVFLLSVSSWMGWTKPLNIAASSLLVLTFLLHTYSLWARIVISGRPPVTNLYSSAVFIGWGCVLLGLIIEAVYRIGVGNVVAAVAGFATLIIAHFLTDGDTFEMLQAVLDTQFWLATHVVCITLGYATTYEAGLLGIFYILRGVYTPSLSPKVSKEFARMIYGTICFSLFFSFVGTVLGGLWADDSWGRFWGWDPKENGALIIVIWNALILHARWGGMIRDRGLAVLAVVGNIVTTWSWFGVNALGAGLHSYGFISGVVFAISIAVLVFLHIIGIGLIPVPQWFSSEARELDKYQEKQRKDGLNHKAMAAAPHVIKGRPLPLRLIAYLNPIYSCYLGIILLASYSMPDLAAKRLYLGYLAVAYLFSMVMLYLTTTAMLKNQRSKGYIFGSITSIFLLANLIGLVLKFEMGNAWLFIIPALAYPAIVLILLNIEYQKMSGGQGNPREGLELSANQA